MSYLTRVSGSIEIVPPLSWGELQSSPFRDRDQHKLWIPAKNEEEVDTDRGQLRVLTGPRIVPWSDDSFRASGDTALKCLQEIVNRHASDDRTFLGILNGQGDAPEDMWRLYVAAHGDPVLVTATIEFNGPPPMTHAVTS